MAVVATRGCLLPDSVQVFTKASVPGEHLRHLVSQGSRPRPTKRPSLVGRARGSLVPARPLSCQGWRAIFRAFVPVPERFTQSELKAKDALGCIPQLNGENDIGVEEFIKEVKEMRVMCSE